MKVLLFTHSQDIDGLGCYVLAKQAFDEVDCELCKTFEITKKVKEYIDDGRIYNYDYVYVTDLCIKEPVLSFINDDVILKCKLKVIDHHKSEIDEGNDKYDFVNIIVEKDGIKVSGTSLFYEYLVDSCYLKASNVLDLFVEWTRQYDVWDWRKLNNYNARKLHIIFETQGYEKYLEMIERIIKENKLAFTDDEEKVVMDFDKKVDDDTAEILSKMIVEDIMIDGINYRIGYILIPYMYRNEMNEKVLLNNENDVDMVGMIMTDIDTVSYRNVKTGIDASMVAVYFGGKGHKNAASNPQDNEKFAPILRLVKPSK